MDQKQKALHKWIKSQGKVKKKIRDVAWEYCQNVLGEIEEQKKRTLRQIEKEVKQRQYEEAETLRGPQKFLLDTDIVVYLPEYSSLPTKPEEGWKFVALVGFGMGDTFYLLKPYAFDSDRGYYLWYNERWVKINGEMMRDVRNSGLRLAWFEAIRFQTINKEKRFRPKSAIALATWRFVGGKYGEGVY